MSLQQYRAKDATASQKNEKRNTRNWLKKWGKPTGAAVVGGVMLGALLLSRQCGGPETETIVKTVDKTPPPAVKGDGKCEVDKGEAFPFTGLFDPESCGYCGNDKIDVWQDDTKAWGRESEEQCPADFHYCGNGRVDEAASYAVIVPNDDGSYSFSIIEKGGESCRPRNDNYCEADCPTEEERPARASRRKRSPKPAKPAASKPVSTATKLSDCPGSVTNSSRARKLASEAKRIVRKSRIRGSDGLGASSGASVTVVITSRVSPQGVVSEKGAKALCFGACEKSSLTGGSVKAVTGSLGLDGKTIDAPGNQCVWKLQIPVASR